MEKDIRPSLDGISPTRLAIDRAVTRAVDGVADGLARHWLFLFNACVGVFAMLPFVAPFLMSVGLTSYAQAIYSAYSYTCHQLPQRSFFIFGQQMAYCERDTAIYLAVLVTGLVFARQRDRSRPLSFKLYLLLIAPMAIDGFTQLFGWRESTWLLRVITGSLFGSASVWLAYPYVQRSIEGVQAT